VLELGLVFIGQGAECQLHAELVLPALEGLHRRLGGLVGGQVAVGSDQGRELGALPQCHAQRIRGGERL
jgi:hypothetical protein